jgi:hypothetical protein
VQVSKQLGNGASIWINNRDSTNQSLFKTAVALIRNAESIRNVDEDKGDENRRMIETACLSLRRFVEYIQSSRFSAQQYFLIATRFEPSIPRILALTVEILFSTI